MKRLLTRPSLPLLTVAALSTEEGVEVQALDMIKLDLHEFV